MRKQKCDTKNPFFFREFRKDRGGAHSCTPAKDIRRDGNGGSTGSHILIARRSVFLDESTEFCTRLKKSFLKKSLVAVLKPCASGTAARDRLTALARKCCGVVLPKTGCIRLD